MGVVVSKVSGPAVTGTPRSNSRVAGAGTGMTPCAVDTTPDPNGTGPKVTESTARCSNSAKAPTTSTSVSTAPSSCRCTLSTDTPCKAASTPARRPRADLARERTPSDTVAVVRISRREARFRAGGSSAPPCAMSRRAVRPPATTSGNSTLTPSTPRPQTARHKACSALSPPAATRAARIMSPAAPDQGSRCSSREARRSAPLLPVMSSPSRWPFTWLCAIARRRHGAAQRS